VFTLDGIRKLHHWTHTSLSIVIDHLATLPAGDFDKELPGLFTLHYQGMHILNCEGFWTHSLAGKPYTDHELSEYPSVADVKRLQHEVAQYTLAYLSGLTDQQLNSTTTLLFPEGNPEVRTPALILHHVLTHAHHHKGQIAYMCRQLGHPLPDTYLCGFE
jgi:uncharacterized damage-inducible protein DinB